MKLLFLIIQFDLVNPKYNKVINLKLFILKNLYRYGHQTKSNHCFNKLVYINYDVKIRTYLRVGNLRNKCRLFITTVSKKRNQYIYKIL